MSFLNPVNEPVLRFKSTDAGAPQINYNARTAGDVKAVLKACLVTGYGATPSAGWSIVNEVNHVAEFVSPSVAMIDYRFGIDDSSSANTSWYYQYKDLRSNPKNNSSSKSFGRIDNSSVNNGWQLLTTERGLILIEVVQYTTVNHTSCRITYFGVSKSANDTLGSDIVFFNTGHGGTINSHNGFYGGANAYVARHATAKVVTTSPDMFGVDRSYGESYIDLASDIYLTTNGGAALLSKLPALMCQTLAQPPSIGVCNITLDGRTFIEVFCGGVTSTASSAYSYSRTFVIPLDYWEY